MATDEDLGRVAYEASVGWPDARSLTDRERDRWDNNPITRSLWTRIAAAVRLEGAGRVERLRRWAATYDEAEQGAIDGRPDVADLWAAFRVAREECHAHLDLDGPA